MKTKRFGKAVVTTMLCGVLMLGSSMTVFAGGGEEVEDPVVEPIFTSEEATETETEPEEKPAEDMTAFTPDGNAQLVDEADEEDGKLFYTITTVNGNYFYVIIDKARDENNVYMLDQIDEHDLMTLIEKQEKDGNTVSVTPAAEDTTIGLKTDKTEEEPKVEPETEKPEKEEAPVQKNDNSVLIIILLVLGGGAGGAYYYLKFVKGKKENFNMDDDLEFYDDEEYENEDEQPEEQTEEAEPVSVEASDTAEDSEEEV